MLNEKAARVRKWIDGGCSSWDVPLSDIEDILNALPSDAAAEREPVALIKRDGNKVGIVPTEGMYRLPDGGPLYAAPPELDQLRNRVKELEKALEPFADIAGEAWADESGWTNAACPNDRIRDWFGPSAFAAARRVREGGKVDG